MEGSYLDAGAWWHRQPGGSLLRWDAVSEQWLPAGPETPRQLATEPWEPIGGRAKALRIVLYVLAGVSAASAISNLLQYQLLSRINHGAAVFVPIFNLWGPKKIANDLWRASDPSMPADAGERWRDAPIPKQLFGNWWDAWLLSSVAARSSGPRAWLPARQLLIRFQP